MEIYKKDVYKVVVYRDMFNIKFRLISNYSPMASLSGASVPHKEYALQSLSGGGSTERILFCCKDPHTIEKFMKESEGPWKKEMDIQVKSSDSCQSVDVIREVNAASTVKGDIFIHFDINTVTNIQLASLLEQYMITVKQNKGAAMTLVLKEQGPEHSLIKSEKSFFLAADNETKKLLVYDKYKQSSEIRTVTLPTKRLLSNAEVIMHRYLVDSNLAVGSPSVLPLFGDNLDFQKLDGFFRRQVIRLDMSADALYFTLLKANHYAAYVTNWKICKTDGYDMVYHYEHPLTVLSDIYKEFHETTGWRALGTCTTPVNRSCTFGGGSIFSNSMDKADIEDNVKIMNSSMEGECSFEEHCNNEAQPEAELDDSILDKVDSNEESVSESGSESESESSSSEDDEVIGLVWGDGFSCFSSIVREDFSPRSSPVPDEIDTFLGDMIDSFHRCFRGNPTCDYLIPEINASRHAHGIQSHVLNYIVVRAVLSLPPLAVAHSGDIVPLLREVITFFEPILKNYIRCKSSAMDCLRAVEESCLQFEWLKAICNYVLHMLYDSNILHRDSLLRFRDYVMETDSQLLQYHAVTMFFEWLQEGKRQSKMDVQYTGHFSVCEEVRGVCDVQYTGHFLRCGILILPRNSMKK